MGRKSKEEIQNMLNEFNSTSAYHKFSPIRGFPVATDGIIALAEAAGCYWFPDIIGSYQTNEKLDSEFQVWTLTVNHEDNTAVVNGYNDTELIITQEIPFTDFPLDELKVYLIDGVILLPSEYRVPLGCSLLALIKTVPFKFFSALWYVPLSGRT